MDRLPGTAERRGSPRVACACALHLHRHQGSDVDVRTVDLGPGGARVASPRPLRVDEEVRFDLELPDGASPVGGWARVLRQHGHDMYALRFERISAPDAARLRAFAATG